MSRRTLVLSLAVFALIGGAIASPYSTNASHPRDTDPHTIAPAQLALPASALPAATAIDHSAVSDNADADGKTTPADGHKSQLAIIHNSNGYESLGRITGYREDIRFTLSGTQAGTEYLASIFPDNATAKAAYNDATAREFNILSFIANPPAGIACQVALGEVCREYAGVNPSPLNGVSQEVVLVLFVHGPILIETATQVPQAQFAALRPTVESTLFAILGAADATIQSILNPQAQGSTATPTSVPATATATPTATPQPTSTATPTPPACFVQLSLAHKTVAAGKKQAVTVSTLPNATVQITVKYPNSTRHTSTGSADTGGSYTYSYKQPSKKTTAKSRTATVSASVTCAGQNPIKAQKKYTIK